jgi:hypothetical protein
MNKVGATPLSALFLILLCEEVWFSHPAYERKEQRKTFTDAWRAACIYIEARFYGGRYLLTC